MTSGIKKIELMIMILTWSPEKYREFINSQCSDEEISFVVRTAAAIPRNIAHVAHRQLINIRYTRDEMIDSVADLRWLQDNHTDAIETLSMLVAQFSKED
jgi:hypothetical protein